MKQTILAQPFSDDVIAAQPRVRPARAHVHPDRSVNECSTLVCIIFSSPFILLTNIVDQHRLLPAIYTYILFTALDRKANLFF